MPERHTIYLGLYVHGQWLNAAAGGLREIRCPADGTLVATVSEGTRPDELKAIRAAREAFDQGDWPSTPEHERGALLLRAAGLAEYRETKHIWQNTRPHEQRWFTR
jgi:betaine-aldehyde dehydrogenase